MHKLLLTAACLFAAAPGLAAQDITGTWQGTLPTANQQRIVLKIVKDEKGSLRASCYHPGTGGSGVPMSSVTFTPPLIDTEQIYVMWGFKGKLSADGKSMEGAWTEGKQSNPLTLTLATPETLWKLDYAADKVMAADADPEFEVATIKPSPPDSQMKRYGIRTRNFKAVNMSASELIRWAYQLQARQIEGAPAWMDKEDFDIAGKPDLPGQPSEDQYRLMMRKLLAERFGLKEHIVQKTFPVYALTFDKAPPTLVKSDLTIEEQHMGIYARRANDGQLEEEFVSCTMPDFAGFLMNVIHDRQIVDETALKGQFDFSMKITADIISGPSSGDEVANDFLEAVHTLGFKLVPKKEPIDVMLIDHIEQPSPN